MLITTLLLIYGIAYCVKVPLDETFATDKEVMEVMENWMVSGETKNTS